MFKAAVLILLSFVVNAEIPGDHQLLVFFNLNQAATERIRAIADPVAKRAAYGAEKEQFERIAQALIASLRANGSGLQKTVYLQSPGMYNLIFATAEQARRVHDALYDQCAPLLANTEYVVSGQWNGVIAIEQGRILK